MAKSEILIQMTQKLLILLSDIISNFTKLMKNAKFFTNIKNYSQIYFHEDLAKFQKRTYNIFCRFHWSTIQYLYPILQIAHTCSAWTCAAITIDRFLHIKYPFQSKIWCTIKRTKIIIISMTCIAVIYRVSLVEIICFINSCNDIIIFSNLDTCIFRIFTQRTGLFSNVGYESQSDLSKILQGLQLCRICHSYSMVNGGLYQSNYSRNEYFRSIMIILNFFVVKEVRKAHQTHLVMQGLRANDEKENRYDNYSILY